jgi:hypothetical protein
MRIADLLAAIRELSDSADDCGKVDRKTVRWPSEKEWHNKTADGREVCPLGRVAVALEYLAMAPVEKGDPKKVDE